MKSILVSITRKKSRQPEKIRDEIHWFTARCASKETSSEQRYTSCRKHRLIRKWLWGAHRRTRRTESCRRWCLRFALCCSRIPSSLKEIIVNSCWSDLISISPGVVCDVCCRSATNRFIALSLSLKTSTDSFDKSSKKPSKSHRWRSQLKTPLTVLIKLIFSWLARHFVNCF